MNEEEEEKMKKGRGRCNKSTNAQQSISSPTPSPLPFPTASKPAEFIFFPPRFPDLNLLDLLCEIFGFVDLHGDAVVPTQDLKLKEAFIGPFLLRHAVAGGDVDAVRNLIKRQKSVVVEMTVRVSIVV